MDHPLNFRVSTVVFLLMLVGCSTSPATETVSLTVTQIPDVDSQTPEPSIEPPEEPVTIDFGSKAVYTQLFFDDYETSALLPGFEFSAYGDAVILSDTDQVIDGNYSVRLSQYGHLKTNPERLPLEGNTTYLVEFDYKILNRGAVGDTNMYFFFQPVGVNSNNQNLVISTFDMLRNAEEQGSFTLGGLTGDEANYVLNISATEHSSIVIDNLHVLRQNAQTIDLQPDHWGEIITLPFPRLGNYNMGTSNWLAYGIGGEPPFSYSVNQIERRLAMFDVIAGPEIYNQTLDPGFAYRLRKLNPGIIILPYRIAQEQNYELPLTPLYENATIDMKYDFQLGLADEWFLKDTNGDPVTDNDWTSIRKMNISEYCPIVNGQTYNDYLIDWVLYEVMTNGQWDGIFFDNLFGRINPHIPDRWNSALLDIDYNLNGVRDETSASASEMTRRAAISLLERLRGVVSDLEIIIGNTGPHPEIHLAPYVNGYTFECVNEAWDSEWLPGVSEPGWRLILQEYFIMQAENISPVTNIFEGCGRTGSYVEPEGVFFEPSEKDLLNHRFTMGTALLGDGFYEYDLFDGRSAPFWFDEYTVNPSGAAEEAPENKGYLGHALGEAVELKSPAKTVWTEDFELRVMPTGIWSDSGRYLSQDPDEVIEGTSLVIDNPDHTQWRNISFSTTSNLVTFTPGETYVVEFDWRIIESLDLELRAYIWNGTDEVPHYPVPGVVAGDSGKAYFPTTIGANGYFRLTIELLGGGGKVAIDNIRVTQGGVGPWRRDFENGFVLVNPLKMPYTFSLEELIGPFGRTGIRRILGNQAPEVNSGQPITDSLTIQPFDAIILLADPIPTE